MSRACYLAIFLSLIIVMTACQSAQMASEQPGEPGGVATTDAEIDIPTEESQAILSLSVAINLHNHRQPKSARKKCAQI
jgi:Na+-transporting methylmalonyl-CoA/oxaloacetate decarboxylase gamma subunit